MRANTGSMGVWSIVVLPSVSPAAESGRPLVDAVKNHDKAADRALLKKSVDVNAAGPDGATALDWAAHWDDLDTASLLTRAGARVNVTNAHGVAPLSLACSERQRRGGGAAARSGAPPINRARSRGCVLGQALLAA